MVYGFRSRRREATREQDCQPPKVCGAVASKRVFYAGRTELGA